jgi:predicted SnoaL-like aldol condensation-catalyzing enzyme
VASNVVASPRDVAIGFLTLASGGRAREAWERYAAPDFVHHNAFVGGDPASLIAAMEDNAREHPAKTLEILRTIAEGPFVAVHSRVRLAPGEPAVATIHLFRIEAGRIVELWDVGQPAPADPPNEHGLI